MKFTVLPNLIALAVLVAIFWAISRKATTERVHLWFAGWAFILLHFAAEFVSAAKDPWGAIAAIVSVDSLVLGGVAFLISVSGIAARRQQLTLALSIAGPALAYATGVVCGITSRNYYFALIAASVLAPSICCRAQAVQSKWKALGISAVAGSAAVIAVWAIVRGNPDLGIAVVLATLNFLIAILYAGSHRRATAGVITAVAGFVLWGAVFPLAILLDIFASGFRPQSEAWNIPKYLVAVGMILTLFEEQIETCKYHAHHDELTGLPNRRLLEDRLARALTYAHRAETKVAVLQLDLDRFKEVNDTYGHRIGDLALQEVAARLAKRIRAEDTLARSGGDEFTVISPVKDRKSAEALVSALELALSLPILIDGREVQTGLSVGIALYPDDGSNADQLHAAADGAMYAVKRSGRAAHPDEALTESSRVTSL
jgi:diguanylate cyclase (GGDEF)-like protein